jgi:hypothetical protein
MKKSLVILLIFILSGSIFVGCKKDKGNPPALPPVASMTIDFSNFVSKKKSEIIGDTKNLEAVSNNNWQFAATLAGFWNTILTINLIVPVTAFKLAIDNKPVYLDNKKWQWSYSVNVGVATYKARLTGQIRTSDINWEMYVSKEGAGAFAEFLWFSGTSDLDGKGGQWILNYSQSFQEPMLQIDWSVTGTDIGSIKYTYIRELNDNRATEPFKGSYIEYGLTSTTLNAFYNVYFYESIFLKAFVDAKIEWSTTNHNGHVKAPYHYGDSNWHSWDGNGNDI